MVRRLSIAAAAALAALAAGCSSSGHERIGLLTTLPAAEDASISWPTPATPRPEVTIRA